MLQSFLSLNKVSLAQPSSKVNHNPLLPSQHQFNKACCMPQQQKKVPQSEPTIPSSPTYKRRKIFELVSVSQSLQTGGFKSVTLEESRVQNYKMPETEAKIQEPKLVVKKKKTCKENGLHFANKDNLGLKKNYLKSMETLPSTLNEIMPESNQRIFQGDKPGQFKKGYDKWGSPVGMKVAHKQSIQSLEMFEGQADVFTFNTSSNPSLEYSETEPYSGNLPHPATDN